MNESQSKQNAAATGAAKDTLAETRAELNTETQQKLGSQVVVFRSNDEPVLEDDGEFDLKINGENVTGTHSFPTSHTVTGKLTGNVLIVNSDDGKRSHKGILVGDKTFIGKRKPNGDAFFQEEGVWVGTKKP